MANDPSRSLPGVETEPAGPNQTPYSGFPGYEEFRVGDPIPGMPGSFVGGEIVNNAGDRWNWVKGEWETAGQPVDLSTPPTPKFEPVSPFEKYLIALENLQAPVELPTSSYQQPAAPAFTPMAAPTAVRVNPASKFGPVTASGYTQPPVDPMSYYSTPEPTPAPTPYTGGPTRWFYFKTSTPDLSIPQSVAQPEQPSPNLSNPQGLNPAPLSPADVSPSAPSQQNNNLQDEFPGYAGLGFGDEIPGMPGTRIGDVIKDDAGNVWNWKEGRWDLAKITDTPLVGPRFETDPVNVSIPIEQQPPKQKEGDGDGAGNTKTDTEDSKGTPTPVVPAPGIVEPPKTPFTFTQRPVIQPPPTRVEAVPYQRKPIINPLIEPTTIPVATRRMIEAISPGYFKDINYDPDEILAAAMRSMGGKQARRSILSEMR